MKKNIIVKAPALSRSGYGEHARYFLRALQRHEDKYEIFLININWGKTSWISDDSEERQWIDDLLQKTILHQQNGGSYDISAQVTIPNEWEKIAPINIGITAGIETTKVAPQWIEKAYLMDKIIVVSEHSKQVYENTSYNARNEATGQDIPNFRCQTPIDVVGYPVKEIEPSSLELDLEHDFNFLTIAQWGPRKNLSRTIKWFVEEFIDIPIGLVIKTSIAKNSIFDRDQTLKNIKNILRKYPDRKCKIYLLHGDMTDEEIAGLYVHPKIKAYYTLTHGEGYGLPIFEAAYSGMPVIAPDWSGHLDFLYAPKEDKKGKVKNKAYFSKVDYTLEPIQKEVVWPGVLEENSQWCYAEQGSTKIRLREVYKDYGRFKKQAAKLQTIVREEYEVNKMYDKFIEALEVQLVPLEEVVVL